MTGQLALFDAPPLRAPGRTFGTLSREGRSWLLSDLEPHVTLRLKQVFERLPKSSPGPFSLVHDLAVAADLSWFMQRYPLKATPGDLKLLEAGKAGYEDRLADLERILLPDYAPPAYAGLRETDPLTGKPVVIRPYQGQAVEVLDHAGGLLLGDEVGLGKTFTAAAACLLPDALPAVVVCQPHLQKQWASVLERVTTLRVHVIKGTRPYSLPEADVYLFRYTQLQGWVSVFAELSPRLVAYDEIQELRTGATTAKGEAAKHLSSVARLKLGLTATPVYGYGAEIWHVMQFLDDAVLGSFDDFTREWCSALGNGKFRIKNPQALGSYLRERHVFLRRTKSDVGQQMPAVNRIVETIDYDEKAVADIEGLARALAIKATTASFVERGQAARELDIMVRQSTGVAKAKGVAAFTRMVVEGGAPVVLVGWHREVYDIWLKELGDLKPALYTGSESAGQKDRAKDAFLAGETDLLILSLRSGAGLDGLQARASTMIFGELDWSPGVHHQCIGRLDREGQDEPVTAIFLVAEDGSDPPMMEVLGIKASEAAHIVDPSLGAQAGHTDASHIQTLVKRYLRGRGSAEARAAA